MPALAVLFRMFQLVVLVVYGIIGQIFHRRLPRWVKNMATAVVVVTGVAGFYMVISTWLLASGIAHNNPTTMFIGFSLLAISAHSTKTFVKFCEGLAGIIMATFGWALNPLGIHLTQIDLGVQEDLTDISMALIMSSVCALNGGEIGLTLSVTGWVSIISLVALVIISGAKITIRRKIMGGVTALFVVTFCMFSLIPATQEFAQAGAEHLQVGVRRAADVVRPATPLDEVRRHQKTEQNVLRSELARYTKEVDNFERAAANHTPTPYEIESYQKAIANVTTFRQSLKLRNPESPNWVSYLWLTFYSALAVGIFAAVFFTIVLPIIRSIPKGGITSGTATQTATPGAPVATGGQTGTATGTQTQNTQHANATAHANAPATSRGHGWLWFAVPAFLVLLVVLVLIYSKMGSAQAGTFTPSASSLPAIQAVSPHDYEVRSITPDGGKFLLDARVVWQRLESPTLSLKVKGGDTVTWRATGTTCTAEPNGGSKCADPDGLVTPGFLSMAETSPVKPGEYPVGKAFYHALLIKIGSLKKGAGSEGSYTVPDGVEETVIEMMSNIRPREASMASGGPEVEVTITRKS